MVALTIRQIKISNYQYFALVSCSYLPLTFWQFSRNVGSVAGIDALWSVVGLYVVGLLLALLHVALMNRYPTQNGASMVILVFGKWLGKLTLAVYVPAYVAFIAVSTKTYIRAAIKPFFAHTPNWALFVALLAICVLGSWYGVEALSRAVTVWYTLTYLAFLLLILIGIGQNSNPVLGWSPYVVSIGHTIHGIYRLFPLWFGFNAVLMIQPYVVKTKVTTWIPFMSITTSFILLFIVFLASVMTFGIEGVVRLNYPTSFLLQLTTLHALLNNAGPLLLTTTIAFNGFFLATHIWVLSVLCGEIAGKGADAYPWFIPGIVFGIVFVELLSGNEDMVQNITSRYLMPSSWVLLFGIPTIILFGTWIRFGFTNRRHVPGLDVGKTRKAKK